MKRPYCHRRVCIRWDNWRRLFRLWVLLGCCWLPGGAAVPQTTLAQGAESVSLTVQLRFSDGSAVANEPVVLQRLPDADPPLPSCRTDRAGRCAWEVTPGLYQLHFDRPLDEISALALAEGGLSGLGITVGEAPITYHITFHYDGRAYFDAAPEAAVPQPILPTGQMLQGGVLPTSPSGVEAVPKPATLPTPTAAPETPAAAAQNHWHLLFYAAGGLCIGLALYLFTHLEQVRNRLGHQYPKGGQTRD